MKLKGISMMKNANNKNGGKKVSKKTKMAGAAILIAVFAILTPVHAVYAAPIKFKLPWDLDYTHKLVQETISELRKKEAENEHKTGDLNGDGEVDIQDVIRLRKYIANPENPDYQIDKEAADINKDGKINSTDVLLLRKMIVSVKKSTVFHGARSDEHTGGSV